MKTKAVRLYGQCDLRLEEFELCVSDFEEGCLDFLVSDFFSLVAFETKNVLIERKSLFYAVYGYADVFNV